MSSRSYWVGLPVGVTVHDDGSIEIDVDMSEAISEITENYDQALHENQVLMDVAVVDSHVSRRENRFNQPIPKQSLGEMRCPVKYSCPFRSSQLHEMAAHIGDTDEKHEAV